MARIVIISKYPPIEGGISSRTFWLARALVERSHRVNIVTDRLDAAPEYSVQQYEDGPEIKDLSIHRPSTEMPWHIPNNNHFYLDLLNTAVQVIKETNAEVIDTGYLVPYGLVGYLASQISGVPFVLRHGGSDIHKFLNAGIFSELLKDAVRKASLVVTDRMNYRTMCQLSDNVVVTSPYVPNPSFFKRSAEPAQEKPTLALIGKSNYYWTHKAWDRVVNIMERLEDKFRFIIVSQGIGFEYFKQYAEKRLDNRNLVWKNFVQPLEMPRLINEVDGVFALFKHLPFPAFSNLVLEVLCCSKRVITDASTILDFYESEGVNIELFSSGIVQIPDNDQARAANIISDHFHQYSGLGNEMCKDYSELYQSYVHCNEKILSSVISKIKLKNGVCCLG